jgi:paraquat-inducible protein A
MDAHYICCHECDEISRIPLPHKPGRYKCPNCGHTLFRYWPGMIEKIYALNLAALFLFIVTNLFPFLTFEVVGNSSEATFTTAIRYLYLDNEYLLAVAVLMTTLIVPALRILLYLLIFGPLHHGIVHRYTAPMLKLLEATLPWGMLDVFLIGVLVSIVKLVKMGTIIPGTSLWAFAVMIVVMAKAQAIFDPHPVWEKIDEAGIRRGDRAAGAAA